MASQSLIGDANAFYSDILLTMLKIKDCLFSRKRKQFVNLVLGCLSDLLKKYRLMNSKLQDSNVEESFSTLGKNNIMEKSDFVLSFHSAWRLKM